MKRIQLVLILLLHIIPLSMAQQMVSIPYDAETIPDAYRDANPDYLIYPASLEGKDSIEMVCYQHESDRIEAIDLGLSVKWATCNVGANFPGDKGDAFAWGELCPKDTYYWANYRFGLSNAITKYHPAVDSLVTLEASDDIASLKWGDQWRTPTKEECEELLDRCRWTLTTQNGASGFKVTGPSGNSIFLPFTGFRFESQDITEPRGRYYTSSLDPSMPTYVYRLDFDDDINYKLRYVGHNTRFHGMYIRPVCP